MRVARPTTIPVPKFPNTPPLHQTTDSQLKLQPRTKSADRIQKRFALLLEYIVRLPKRLALESTTRLYYSAHFPKTTNHATRMATHWNTTSNARALTNPILITLTVAARHKTLSQNSFEPARSYGFTHNFKTPRRIRVGSR